VPAVAAFLYSKTTGAAEFRCACSFNIFDKLLYLLYTPVCNLGSTGCLLNPRCASDKQPSKHISSSCSSPSALFCLQFPVCSFPAYTMPLQVRLSSRPYADRRLLTPFCSGYSILASPVSFCHTQGDV
jgi:hypothetical protein